MSALLERQLVVVTGKGGVGRTTVSAALARALARAGRRVAAVELSGQDNLARSFGFDEGLFAPRTAADGVDVMSLTATACVADFGRRKLRIPTLARWFFESRVMTGFLEAVPGMHDVVQLGKIENMLREPRADDPVYDVAVLDAPATGHGLTLLAAARSMAEMTRVGPFHDLAHIIGGFLEDPEATASVLVTLPELLPVNEGLELVASLAREHRAPEAILVNQVQAPWPDDVDRDVLLGALASDTPPQRALRGVVQAALDRDDRQHHALDLLQGGVARAAGEPVPVHTLPRLDDPTDPHALIAAIGDVLEAR